MKCNNCGKKINKTFKLCPHCGEKVEYMKKEKYFKLDKKILIIIGSILIALIAITSIIIFNNKVDFEKLKSSVVMINVYDETGELFSTGSGVVAFENDIVLTNAHVVEDNYKIEVISENNTKYQVEGILDYNKKKDIAILKLVSSKGLKKVKIGKKVKVGSNVTAIGSPLGLKNTISTGIISAMFQDNIEVYQHTAPISPGSSGGALFNSKGELIGITYASLTSGQNLNLAIPIEYFKKEYNRVKGNEIIDTQYYKYLNNSIIKSEKGIKLLQYILNDKYENDEDNIHHQCFGTFGNKNSSNPCYNINKGDYKDGAITYYGKSYLKFKTIYKYINDYIYITSGNRGYSVQSLEDGKEGTIEYLVNPELYSIEIYSISSSKDMDKIKSYILESQEEDKEIMENKEIKTDGEEIVETEKVLYGKNYVGVYRCINYDDCDTVKKLVESIVNQ